MSFRYLLTHPVDATADLVTDPLEVLGRLQERFADLPLRRRPLYPYQTDANWEERLHRHLGAPWPCQFTPEFLLLWPQVMKELEAKGIHPGPAGFKAWNDGDAGFVRAVWCLTRHLKPDQVIETGVAHGVTSRFILEALERNQRGHLWSIDLPPLERTWQKQIGMAVGNRFGDRWNYIRGSSRRHLLPLLARLGRIDLFIHDSLHSERNVRFEMDRAWAAVRPAGALVVDDIDVNWGFHTFTQSFRCNSLICEAEPIRPDLRRSNQKGMFGIIVPRGASAA